jgi:charged multivesicular body protein 7
MDAMAEANADAQEVDQTIRIGADVALGIDTAFDEAELEEELSMLAQEAENEKLDARLGDQTLKTPDARPSPVGSEAVPQREGVLL